jgi:cation transport ATPase
MRMQVYRYIHIIPIYIDEYNTHTQSTLPHPHALTTHAQPQHTHTSHTHIHTHTHNTHTHTHTHTHNTHKNTNINTHTTLRRVWVRHVQSCVYMMCMCIYDVCISIHLHACVYILVWCVYIYSGVRLRCIFI